MHPQLHHLDALAGEWTTEMTHPAFAGTVVRGHVVAEWLEGGRFLIHRARTDHPDFPDQISIVGAFDDALQMHYYDSRGVHRIYAANADEREWRLWRDDPHMAQRFTGAVAADRIDGLWQASRDGGDWEDDLRIVYERRPAAQGPTS
jgi:hypothetical protein